MSRNTDDGTPSRNGGRLESVPEPLRPIVRTILDPMRRVARRVWQLLLFFSPWRIARTFSFLLRLRREARTRRAGDAVTVAIDINAFWEPLTGIGWYLYLLLEELRDREDLELRLYGPQMIVDENAPQPTVELPHGSAIEVVHYEVPQELCIPRALLIRILRRFERFLVAADRNQVVFAPNYFPPERLKSAGGQLVATIHDLGFKKVPWTLREETRRLLASNLEACMKKASIILTDSETVRQELIASGYERPEAARTVHLGPGHLDRVTARAALPEGLRPGYGLHVGTLEPRKNLEKLLEAWEIARRDHGLDIELVLCGHSGWKSDALLEKIGAASREGWLHHFGYVDEGLLGTLYDQASFFACSSLYEGFGLPLLEAMGAGLPVICSDIPVFREVAGSAATFCDPEKPELWAVELSEIAGSSSRRDAMTAASRRRFADFSWAKTAGETAAAWLQVARPS